MQKLIVTLVAILAYPSVAYTYNPNRIATPSNTSAVFIENKGQITDQYQHLRKDIDYKIDGGAVTVFVGDGQLHYQWTKAKQSIKSKLQLLQDATPERNEADMYRMDVTLVGANKNAEVINDDRQAYYENHYTPLHPDGVLAHSYQKITYKNVYPNIDWVLYTNSATGGLKYDFVVHEGGNANDIRLKYEGSTELQMQQDGNFIASTPFGSITEQAPYSYEAATGKVVNSKFTLLGNTLSFNTASHTGAMVIDPALKWSTYYGSTGQEGWPRLATDTAGNCYMSAGGGGTNVATIGPFATTGGGGPDDGGYMVKFNINGVRQWALFYPAAISGLAVDKSGNVYISGNTRTAGLGTTGSYQPIFGGGTNTDDVLIAKFDGNGTRQWSTYYGTTSSEISYHMAGDGNNLFLDVYPVGTGHDSIVKFNLSGYPVWSKLINNHVLDMACDGRGNVYVGGRMDFLYPFTTTPGAHQTTNQGLLNATLMKIDGTGVIKWATYYGGNAKDGLQGLTCDNEGNVYAAGYTNSSNNIATPGTFQTTLASTTSLFEFDGMLVKFDSNGVRKWGSYYGGRRDEMIRSVAFDGKDIWLTGYSDSGSVLATTGALKSSTSSDLDVIIAKFTTTGQRIWGSYFGGSSPDQGTYITNSKGRIFFAGQTQSSSGIALNAHQSTNAGGPNGDNFLALLVDRNVYLTPPFTDTITCTPDSLYVDYATTDTFDANNVFTIQLSNASSSFSSPTTIATINGRTGGKAACYIPMALPFGTGYRFRITASSPADTSDGSSVNIKIGSFGAAAAAIYANPNDSICAGTSATLVSVASTQNPLQYQWYKNGSAISGATAQNYTPSSIANNDSFYVTVKDPAASCYIPQPSNILVMTVIPFTGGPSVSISADPDTNITSNQQVKFTANVTNCSGQASYKWYNNGVLSSTSNPWTTQPGNGSHIYCIAKCNGWCSVPDTALSDTLGIHVTTGISNTISSQLPVSLYPNPNGGKFVVQAGWAKGNIDIEVVNTIGQRIISKTVHANTNGLREEIEMNNLANGIYFIKLSDTKGTQTLRFTIAK